ncbi:MAG: response regulator [Chloroflexota bacterium]
MPSYRILIVEDQREVSRLLRSALETLEHNLQVVEIPSGEEAILDSSRNPVDLLVADYRLPGMTGLELMAKVRRFHADVKVILVTGQTDPKVRRQIAEAGADAFFIKPVPMADFLDAVERHLGLVETILPPEPISTDEDEDAESRRSLPDLLAGLRQDIEATAVLLLNDEGRVLARAGDLPDANAEVSLLSSLLSIYSAGQKVSRLLGQKTFSSWFIFNGGVHDLIFSPAAEGHAVLFIGPGLAEEARALRTVEIWSSVRPTIEKAVGEITQPVIVTKAVQEPLPPPLEAVESSAKEMEPLFKDARKKLKSADVDEFWNKAAKKHKAPTKPDMLTYEQAKQLGLTPEDKP